MWPGPSWAARGALPPQPAPWNLAAWFREAGPAEAQEERMEEQKRRASDRSYVEGAATDGTFRYHTAPSGGGASSPSGGACPQRLGDLVLGSGRRLLSWTPGRWTEGDLRRHAHQNGVHHQGPCGGLPPYRRDVWQRPVYHRGQRCGWRSPGHNIMLFAAEAAFVSLRKFGILENRTNSGQRRTE